MDDNVRTERRFWDKYWDKRDRKLWKGRTSLQVIELRKLFHHYLPVNENWQVLEIGGAYGDYLMYLAHHFNYRISSLDYSSAGNTATRKIFKEAGTEIQIFERDLFSDLSDLPLFDLVYSLGFIEHFENPLPVIEKHVSLLKPGGILMIGAPNLTGIYQKVLNQTAPSFKESHNLEIMDIEKWGIFERQCGIEPIYKAYIGGFEPLNMKKLENDRAFSILLYYLVTFLTVLLSFNFSFLRKINSKFLSGYMIGIYKKR
ncbi:MAG: class I SAM-dependent methyltransferase [bacterium]